MMGFGPVFVFPTATHESAGQGAWQVGPAFGAIYKGIPGLLVGCLLQNPISFAYTSPDRRPLNTLLVQPILLKHLWRGLYVKSADASWAFGWRDGSPTTLPLSLGPGYVIRREGLPALNVFVSKLARKRDFRKERLPTSSAQSNLWSLDWKMPTTRVIPFRCSPASPLRSIASSTSAFARQNERERRDRTGRARDAATCNHSIVAA
jgi:hypothetical protein